MVLVVLLLLPLIVTSVVSLWNACCKRFDEYKHKYPSIDDSQAELGSVLGVRAEEISAIWEGLVEALGDQFGKGDGIESSST